VSLLLQLAKGFSYRSEAGNYCGIFAREWKVACVHNTIRGRFHGLMVKGPDQLGPRTNSAPVRNRFVY